MPDFDASKPLRDLPRSPRHAVWWLGLTGGIGSGKSTAAQCLAELGAAVVDADAISRTLTAPGGAAIAAIAAVFGAQAIDATGAMHREVVRAKVFENAALKSQLEAILHPLIRTAVLGAAQKATAAGAPLVVLDIPLLAEGWERWADVVDAVAVVHAPADVRTARVQRRSGLAPEQIAAIMAAQASDAQRLGIAHWVLDNSGDRVQPLRAQTQALAAWLLRKTQPA